MALKFIYKQEQVPKLGFFRKQKSIPQNTHSQNPDGPPAPKNGRVHVNMEASALGLTSQRGRVRRCGAKCPPGESFSFSTQEKGARGLRPPRAHSRLRPTLWLLLLECSSPQTSWFLSIALYILTCNKACSLALLEYCSLSLPSPQSPSTLHPPHPALTAFKL